MKPVTHSSRRVTGDREVERKNNMDPLTVAPRWALCPLDWQVHAIDAWSDHPLGVWTARCGHRLSGGTPLYDVPKGSSTRVVRGGARQPNHGQGPVNDPGE